MSKCYSCYYNETPLCHLRADGGICDNYDEWKPKEPEKNCETCRFGPAFNEDGSEHCWPIAGTCTMLTTKDKWQPREDKMETINYDTLVVACCDREALDDWHKTFGIKDVTYDRAYEWLIKKPKCWKEFAMKRLDQTVRDYIAEQEKPPCDECIYEDPEQGMMCSRHGVDCSSKDRWYGFKEKPKRTVEEIIKKWDYIEDPCTPQNFTMGAPQLVSWHRTSARYIALAANNFATDRAAMERVAKELKRYIDGSPPSSFTLIRDAIGTIEARLVAHDKDAAEMGVANG